MKNSKNKKLFTYMVVGALSLALSISCKSNEEPTSDTGWTHQQNPAQGSYTNGNYGSRATVTINDDGTCTISGYGYFDTTDFQYFSIRVIKWYQYYNDYIAYAGKNLYGTEKSECSDISYGYTFNRDASSAYIQVEYNNNNGHLGVTFGPEGKRYWTGRLSKVD